MILIPTLGMHQQALLGETVARLDPLLCEYYAHGSKNSKAGSIVIRSD
jgi:hypothetical protein